MSGAHRSLSVLERRNRAWDKLKSLGWDHLSPDKQLKLIGAKIKELKSRGLSTKALESLVDALIDLDAEPGREDLEMAEIWEKRKT